MAATPERFILSRYAVVLAGAAGTIDFGHLVGAVYVRNAGPASCHIKFDGVPVLARADNQPKLLKNESLNLQNIYIRKIGIFCLVDDTQCELDATGTIATP